MSRARTTRHAGVFAGWRPMFVILGVLCLIGGMGSRDAYGHPQPVGSAILVGVALIGVAVLARGSSRRRRTRR